MGSTRLPGKILEKVDETNHVLKFLINQLEYSRLLDKIIIATNRNVEDEMQLITKIKKSCKPFLYYNKSTIPNLVIFESVVEIVNGVLHDLIFV